MVYVAVVALISNARSTASSAAHSHLWQSMPCVDSAIVQPSKFIMMSSRRVPLTLHPILVRVLSEPYKIFAPKLFGDLLDTGAERGYGLEAQQDTRSKD